jgi:hypothetical protein
VSGRERGTRSHLPRFQLWRFDRETFAIFMDSLAEEVATRQIANACFIIDNCPIQNVDDVTQACEMFGCEFDFLPPSSPMLNSIEGCIGVVKLAVQTQFATALRPALLNLASATHGQHTRRPEQLILQALTAVLAVITPQLVRANQDRMLGQFPQMLTHHDVEKIPPSILPRFKQSQPRTPRSFTTNSSSNTFNCCD